MDFYSLTRLREKSCAIRLIRADNAPFIISFLYQAYIKVNRRSIALTELQASLADALAVLRSQCGDDAFPQTARAYLDAWSNDETPYLRKYYSAASDEPQFDLHPDSERAMRWLQSLGEAKPFIGTESRLLTVFRLLQDIIEHTEADPAERIARLEKERSEIDRKIAEVQQGVLRSYDPREISERVIQAQMTAQELLADFRKVEENFRALDRTTRERIATSGEEKGILLDEIFGEHDVIWNSDQGKSFGAFWEFLMSRERQDELRTLVTKVEQIDGLVAGRELDFLKLIQRHLIEAGEPVYHTNNLLSEQLRKFLSSQAYLENKRIAELIRGIEKSAVEIAASPPEVADFSEVSALKPAIQLIMGRMLFPIPSDPLELAAVVNEGLADADTDALYDQIYVDIRELDANVRQALRIGDQVSLAEVIGLYPLAKGLAEIIGYLSLAVRNPAAVIDDSHEEQLVFTAKDGAARSVTTPKIIFCSDAGVV